MNLLYPTFHTVQELLTIDHTVYVSVFETSVYLLYLFIYLFMYLFMYLFI